MCSPSDVASEMPPWVGSDRLPVPRSCQVPPPSVLVTVVKLVVLAETASSQTATRRLVPLPAMALNGFPLQADPGLRGARLSPARRQAPGASPLPGSLPARTMRLSPPTTRSAASIWLVGVAAAIVWANRGVSPPPRREISRRPEQVPGGF